MKIQQQEEKMDVDSTPVKADKKDHGKEDGANVFVTPMREDPRFSKEENQKRSERYSGVKVRKYRLSVLQNLLLSCWLLHAYDHLSQYELDVSRKGVDL